ncbi:MAG: hypothetical protein U9N45_06935, partial [Gemmatimonadota bacterium]|nr:hypothetical protein [Gemmatimonadota bacterium]
MHRWISTFRLFFRSSLLTILFIISGSPGTAPGLLAAGADREILVVFGIHQDIGYMDDYETMMRDYRERMLAYLDLMDRYPGLTVNWGNLYNLKDFLQHFPAQHQRIKRFVKQGRMDFPAQWVDYEPDWTPGEYIIRQAAHSIAYLKREFGCRSQWCHLLDTPSITPQYAQVLAKCGIIMCLLHYGYHTPDYERFHAPPGLPVEAETALRGGAYEYVGLDGSSVIGYMGKDHYSALMTAFGWGARRRGAWRMSMDRFARHFTPAEKVAGVKLAHCDEDHGLTPRRVPLLIDSVEVWNRESPYADSTLLRFGTVDELLRSFEAARSETDLPEFTGQTRPWVWSGRYFERGRYYINKAISEVLAAEKLASFNSMLGLAEYPEGEVHEIWEGLLWPPDHNWLAGTDTDGYKAEAAYKSHLEARELLDRELYTLAAVVKTDPARRALVIFNPLNWTRSYPVSVKVTTRAAGFRVHPCSGGESRIAWSEARRRAGRTIHFIARDVPPLGYRTYYLEELDKLPELQPEGLSARGDTL